MSPEQITNRVGAIVDGLDEVWTLVSDLIAEMQTTQAQMDACSDLDLHELQSWLGSTSSRLWRKTLPAVLADHFTNEPDPDRLREDRDERRQLAAEDGE